MSDADVRVVIDPENINEIYIPYLDNTSRIQIYYGGSSSGKSVFLAQRDVIKVLRGGRNILICRQVGRTLRGSVVQEVTKVIREWGLSDLFTINKTDGTITCVNGYQMVFSGLDDVEKLKSITPAKGVFTDIRVDEATEMERSSLKQLLKRQRGGDVRTRKTMTLSFNPVLQSNWIYTDYFAPLGWADSQTEYTSDTLSILKTWYVHNRFLTPDDIADLENETDEYFKSVYTFGNWGILGDVIFTNWTVEDLSGMQAQFTNRRHGLDFGFSSDPAAMACTHYDRKYKTIYIYDELYERGLTNDLLAEEVKKRIESDRVVCDSAEPKSIAELKKLGVNSVGAIKGKDSVEHGIQWLKQQRIIIDKKCVNSQNEFRQYHWKKDKDGNATRQPSDKNNHILDGLRYGYEDESNAVQEAAGEIMNDIKINLGGRERHGLFR